MYSKKILPLATANLLLIQLKSEAAKCAERKLNQLLYFHMQPTFPFPMRKFHSNKSQEREQKNGTQPALHNRSH